MAPDVEHDMNLQDALTMLSQHCGASPCIDTKLPLRMAQVIAMESLEAVANYTARRECIGNGRGVVQIELGQSN